LNGELANYTGDFLKTLGHPTRIKILEFLKDGEKCVCDIVPALDLEQSNVSRHLSLLKKEGILDNRKDGLKVIYRIRDNRIFDVINSTIEIMKDFYKEKSQFI
jgi:ArsR family transcriptional regulator